MPRLQKSTTGPMSAADAWHVIRSGKFIGHVARVWWDGEDPEGWRDTVAWKLETMTAYGQVYFSNLWDAVYWPEGREYPDGLGSFRTRREAVEAVEEYAIRIEHVT